MREVHTLRNHLARVQKNVGLDIAFALDGGSAKAIPAGPDADAGAGTLTCLEDCTFDYSDCSKPPDGWEQPGGVETEAPGCSLGDAHGPSRAWLVAGLVGLVAVRRRRGNKPLVPSSKR